LMRDHVRTHKKAECKICKRKFNSRSLEAHVRRIHSDRSVLESVKCEKCPKTFKTTENLQRHIKFKHETKFQCKICSKTFAFSRLLKDHLKVHENPETFQCKICKRAFVTSNNLKIHMKLIHADKNLVNKFKCEKCEYSSYAKKNLKEHQKVHERYEARLKSRSDWIKCEKCPAIFGDKYGYKSHCKNFHTKFQFECDFCGMQTKWKNYVILHFKTMHVKSGEIKSIE
jgi:transcriptional repressor CTCF